MVHREHYIPSGFTLDTGAPAPGTEPPLRPCSSLVAAAAAAAGPLPLGVRPPQPDIQPTACADPNIPASPRQAAAERDSRVPESEASGLKPVGADAAVGMAWRMLRRKEFQTGLLNLAFRADHGDKKHFSNGAIGNLSQFYRSDRPQHAASCMPSNHFTIRNFHAGVYMLAWSRKKEDVVGLKAPKKEKRVKKENRMQPPVEAPYVAPKPKIATKSPDKTVEIFDGMTLLDLSKRTGAYISTLQGILADLGEKVESEFDSISIDLAELVAMELGVNTRRMHTGEGTNEPRPAVVTVMGHVDHAKEAGGITQHIGAFVVEMQSGASITFLDTPGHAAFSAMRARGAAVTDIVVLVVAADDGVMPQTLEAMSHAKAANVPVVVAINKCDKSGADPERVRIQLGSEGLLLEDMGGDVQVVEISAVAKSGLDKLEEALLLQAEMMDLKARIDGPAQAFVVEARVDRGRGPLATAIVKSGTLVSGQHIVVGAEWGRIRSLRDTAGNITESAKPAMPVEIEGLRGLPMAGDDVVVVDSEERARMLSQGRKKKQEKDRLRKIDEGMADELEIKEETPERVEMPIIVKADVQGSVQAVSDALRSLNSAQVFVNVVHVGVGPISQHDIDLAQACGAYIVGFNIRTPPIALTQAAARANIKVLLHKVIYHLLEEMGRAIVEKAPGTAETQVSGEAEVLNIFELKGRSKSKGPDIKIAGCRITDGHFSKSGTMRLLRSGDVVFEGPCASLKREKQDAETIEKGNDCGLVIEDCDDFQVGDVIQCLEQELLQPSGSCLREKDQWVVYSFS
ncbi:translation initiation factor IF-2 isoform X1 [Panicum miliaceum]|uniref:Translation initiation factor IF-2, mitochondrial n=1 Tax=Panicum miliaceum TaxID=4540 RepID=A0A3L6Q6J5_PANMI|nr:translation initiation factor IF-2 isoform X1 [Panicum miliaceum]